jgi:acetoin utilization protein AcuB
MKTAAVMTRKVVVVSPAVSVGCAASMMARLRIRHLPVLESERLVGILSDRDVLTHKPDEACREAMTPAPVTCSPSTSVGRVARLMLDHGIDSIPIVTSSGALAGLVTSSDLLALLVDDNDAQVLPFDFRLQIATSDAELLASNA